MEVKQHSTNFGNEEEVLYHVTSFMYVWNPYKTILYHVTSFIYVCDPYKTIYTMSHRSCTFVIPTRQYYTMSYRSCTFVIPTRQYIPRHIVHVRLKSLQDNLHKAEQEARMDNKGYKTPNFVSFSGLRSGWAMSFVLSEVRIRTVVALF